MLDASYSSNENRGCRATIICTTPSLVHFFLVMSNSHSKSYGTFVTAAITLGAIALILLSSLNSYNPISSDNLATQTTGVPTGTPVSIEAINLMLKGEQAMVENDYQGAVTIFSKVIDLVPGYENAYIKRSLANKALGLYQQSLADLSMVMELSGETGDLLKQRGDLYVLAGEDAQAVEDYTQAISFDPADFEAYF